MRSVFLILATDLKDLTLIGLFDFLEWNEAHVVATIRRRLGWTKPSYWNITWQADCKVHWFKKFLYKEMLGLPKNNELFSGMAREKMITIEEALTRLREDNKLLEDFLAEFVAEHDINSPDFAWAVSCGGKHEETDNNALHRTPKASAFLAFAIFSINVAYAKSSLAFGAGELHVMC